MGKEAMIELPNDGKPPAEQRDRPLVTFALFAYNQEKYIHEAVEGAFSQTYEPLEIILSDDCSADRTFEIMQEMAAAYRGTHKVRAIRQAENLGTFNHLITVARLARGQLLIANAGDDISYPQRTSMLANRWKQTCPIALCSWHDEISESGLYLKRNCSFPVSRDLQRLFAGSETARRINGVVQGIIGFASAYQRQFIANLPLSEEKLFVEDGIASSIANIRGERIERVEESLIAYRLVPDSQSLRQADPRRQAINRREEKISRCGWEISYRTNYVIKNAGVSIEQTVLTALIQDKHYGEFTHKFWDSSVIKRVCRLFQVTSRRELFYIIPRLLGFNIFVAVKVVQIKLSAFIHLLKASESPG